MKTEDFQGLLESVREAKQILRGEKQAAREFVVEVPLDRSKGQTSYVICIQTDDPSLLIPRKIYEANYSHSGLVRVVDEAGAATLYPENFFIPIAFPKEVERVSAQVGD